MSLNVCILMQEAEVVSESDRALGRSGANCEILRSLWSLVYYSKNCMFVYRLAYLKKTMSKLHNIFCT